MAQQNRCVTAASASSNVTHLRFDLCVHIKRNVLQAGYTLADLIKLLVQFSEKE